MVKVKVKVSPPQAESSWCVCSQVQREALTLEVATGASSRPSQVSPHNEERGPTNRAKGP